MKNWIMNFIADERGSEGPELAITTLVVAGGAIAGFGELKGALKTKQDNMVNELGTIDVD
jgi:Flp pilus assembly pilin Flp